MITADSLLVLTVFGLNVNINYFLLMARSEHLLALLIVLNKFYSFYL